MLAEEYQVLSGCSKSIHVSSLPFPNTFSECTLIIQWVYLTTYFAVLVFFNGCHPITLVTSCFPTHFLVRQKNSSGVASILIMSLCSHTQLALRIALIAHTWQNHKTFYRSETFKHTRSIIAICFHQNYSLKKIH